MVCEFAQMNGKRARGIYKEFTSLYLEEKNGGKGQWSWRIIDMVEDSINNFMWECMSEERPVKFQIGVVWAGWQGKVTRRGELLVLVSLFITSNHQLIQSSYLHACLCLPV